MSEAKHICKHCNREFQSGQKLGGHVTRCSDNPRYIQYSKVKADTLRANALYEEYVFSCRKCGKSYSLKLSKRAYEGGNYKKHCSSNCANSRIHSNQTKAKISKSKERPKVSNYCVICGIEARYQRKTCSAQCLSAYQKKIKKGRNQPIGCKTGGFRQKGGRAKVYEYTNWTGQIMYLNREQIIVATLLDQHKLNWERNKIGFDYIDLEGNNRKFYPDFKVNQTYLQYKGWVTEQMQHKMNESVKRNNIPLLIVVGSKRFQKYGITLDQFKQKLTSLV